jgi:hypothetical protein
MDQNVSFSAGIKATRTKYGLGLPYTAYIIQVRVEQDQNFTSWNVSRRFNAFYSLNQKLEKRHPNVKGYPFPRKNRMTRYDHSVIEMRCKELSNYLTRCLEIPAVADDVEFRTFLGFPSNFMNLKARAYTLMPDAIEHGEAGEGEHSDGESSSDDNDTPSKPPALVAPPSSTNVASSSSSKPPVPAKPAITNRDSTPSNGLVPPQDDDGVAMFDYAGSEPGELAFKVGEIIHMIESEAPPDWAAGYTDKSTADKPGYFPRSFVRPFTSEDYIYNSSFKAWSLRDDITSFTYDPSTMKYSYANPPRTPAKSLYK